MKITSLFYFLPVTVFPTLESKFTGAETTVFTVETDVLATFFVVFDTDLPTEEIGLKSDAASHTAGRTSANKINITTTAARTHLNFTTMMFTLFDMPPKKEISSLKATTPRH